MKQLKLVFGLLLLFAAGVVACGYLILNQKSQAVEITEQIPNVMNQGSSLMPVFVGCSFLALFFVVFLGILLFMSEILKKIEDNFKYEKLKMANLEVISRTLIESQQLAHTTAFFKGITNIYQNLYESILKIVSYSFFFPEALKKDSSDLFSFCRAIQTEIHKNPEMIIKFRQTFKRNEKVQADMAKLIIKYQRFLELLKKYDKDGLLYQYITEGSIGEVMDILTKAYEDVRAELGQEFEAKQKEEIVLKEVIIETELKKEESKKEEDVASVLESIKFDF